jgi:Holliday junction resolvase RusA-like endonuclease
VEIVTFIKCDPVPKARPRFTMGGRAYTAKATVNAEIAIRENMINSLLKEGITPSANILLIKRNEKRLLTPIFGEMPISIKINFFLKKPKSVRRKYPTARPDLDNYLKLVFDALNGVLFVDDSQIVEIGARKLYCSEDNPDPGVALKIKRLL